MTTQVVGISHFTVGALTVLNRVKTQGTASREDILPELQQDMMAAGQEMAQFEGSLGRTV